MKKTTLLTILGAVVAIAIYWMGFMIGSINTEDASATETVTIIITDEYIMDRYILDEYGTDYYGELGSDEDEDIIWFRVYSEDGEERYSVSISREYYQNKYSIN